jgi:hypothetical protein
MDRRTVARLDAAVIECTDYKQKGSYKALIEELKEAGITVTFDQIEKSVHRLGLKWRDVFLPATRLERGHPDARASEHKPNTTGQGPDIWSVLNRIELLEQTLATSGLEEYRGLLQQAQTESGLAKERAAAIRIDMKTLLNRVEELHSQQQALLRLVSSIRLTQNRQQSEQATSTQETQP